MIENIKSKLDKIVIEWGNEGRLSSIVFLDSKKPDQLLSWYELSREEQLQVLNSLHSNYELFRRFLKEE